MERLVTFEQFAEQKAKENQVQLEQELNTKREASANSFKDLLAEFGVTSIAELSEEDRPKFNERLGTLTESALLLEGTRSQVGKIDKKGKITSVYVHYDGYPENMVPLIKNYDKKGVDQLVKLGKSGISYLDKEIGKKQDFNNPTRGTTLFYGRDRGENNDMTTTWSSAADVKGYFKEVANDAGAEYVYLYDERDGKWYMGDTYGSPTLQVVESVNEAIAVSGKRTAKKVALRLTKLFANKLTAVAADKVTHLGFLKELYFRAMEDANFGREAGVSMNKIKGKLGPVEVAVEGLGGLMVRVSAKTIKGVMEHGIYADIANAGDWSGIGITEGFAMYLDQLGEAKMAQDLLDSFNAQFEGEEKRVSRTEKLYELSQNMKEDRSEESVTNEAKFDKKKLLKLIKNQDDAEILVNGNWYIIYNPDNGNDENTEMWAEDDVIYALDPDGEEHEISYKDIEQFKESVVTEAKSFSKSELESTAQAVADAVAKTSGTRAEVIEFEMNPAKGRVAGFYIQKATNKSGAPDRYWITDSGEVVSAFRQDTFGDGVVGKVGSKLADFIKSFKANESVVTEADIKSDDDFKEYAFTVLQKAFGEDFDEAKAQEVVDGILGKVDGDYGKAAGILQSSLG